jgi:hypothetical protein
MLHVESLVDKNWLSRSDSGQWDFRALSELPQTSQLNPQQTDTSLCSFGFLEHERYQVVIMGVTRVGCIDANNTRPAEFIRDNLLWCVARRASRATMKHFCWRKTSRQRKMSGPAGSFEVAVASLRSGPREDSWPAVKSQGTPRVAEDRRRKYPYISGS